MLPTEGEEAIESILYIVMRGCNHRLDLYLRRGLEKSGWRYALQGVIFSAYAGRIDERFISEGKNSQIRAAFNIGKDAMIRAVRSFYLTGEYGMPGVIEYDQYRNGGKAPRWVYYSF